MMSAQPLTPSNKHHSKQSKWQEISELAELLLHQPDFESQVNTIVQAFERIFSAEVKLWLAEPYRTIIKSGLLETDTHYLAGSNALMQRAYDARHISTNAEIGVSDQKLPLILALPLICGEASLGVIQLKCRKQAGFTKQDIDLASSVGLQSSIILNQQYYKSICTHQEKYIEQISSVAQLSKSISSNLDWEGLINSVLSLIHQQFGFSRVKLFTNLDEVKKTLVCTGISQQGLEAAHIYYYERENGPISWVIKNQQLLVIKDNEDPPGFSLSSQDEQTKAELIIPLTSGETCLGALDFCSEESNSFEQDRVNVFKSLAENIALAIRNATLFQSEQLQRRIAERMWDLVGSISAETTLDDVIEDLLAELEHLVPCDACALWLYENLDAGDELGQLMPVLKIAGVRVPDHGVDDGEKSATLNISKVKELLSENEDDPAYLDTTYPWLAELASSRQPIIRSAEAPLEPLGETLAFQGNYSVIGVPLTIHDHTLGVIVMVNHQMDVFGSEAETITSTFATYASIGIENTRLYNVAHDQVWISTVMQQVADTIRSASSTSELLDTIASILADLVGALGCTMYLWDQSTEALYPQASYGYDNEQQARMNAWEMDPKSLILVDQLLQTKSPVVLNPDNVPDGLAAIVFPAYSLQTDLLILFPMIVEDELIGAVLVDFTNTEFTKNASQKLWDDKYTLVQGVTDQTAIAIGNLQRLRSREEEAYISIALLQVAQAIVSMNQLDDILASIVRITPILVGIKRCIIYLWESDTRVIRLAQQYGFSKNELQIIGQDMRLSEFPLVETIMERNQIGYYQLDPDCTPMEWNDITPEDLHLIESLATDSDEQVSIKLDDQLLHDKARMLIGFPLAVQSEVLGVMLIEEEDPRKGAPSYHIREKRVEIVNGITQQAAIAIKNELLQQEARKSERMERELQLAREIQSTFLPDQIPELTGWEMDVRWQPAREVGGDFYDILTLDDNKLGVVIADVADKGMPAALFMTLIRTLIRAAASDNSSPAQVLRQVNELLIPDAKHGMFVTVFYAVIDLSSGRIVYTNAGHNPPIIRNSQTNELVELTRTSIALGIFDEIEVEEREAELNPGDWMLLYTDGVTEAFSKNDEMFGTQRLFNLLSGSPYTSAKGILDTIESSVYEFIAGTDLSDDVTLVSLYRLKP